MGDTAVSALTHDPEGSFYTSFAHVGLIGDRFGLCGAPTKGIPARPDLGTCVVCLDLWANMTRAERDAFLGRRQ